MALTDFPPVAPKDSESHLRLIEAAESNDIDTEILRDFLWQIGAHDHLLALPNAAANIQQILDQAPESWGKYLTRTGIATWRPIVNWIVASKVDLTRIIGAHFGKETNTTGHNPMLGSGAAIFPTYTVLCEKPPPGIYGERYLLLAGQLLLSSATAMQEESSRNDYERTINKKDWKPLPNDINTATLAVRRLSEAKFNHRLLDLPLKLSPDEFAETLEELTPPTDKVLANDQVFLCRFLQKAWGIIEWVDRSSGGGGGTGGHRWVGGRLEVGSRLTIENQMLGDNDDAYGAWGNISIAKVTTTSVRKKTERIKSDLSPDEDEDDEEILLNDVRCSKDVEKRDPGAQARANRAKKRYTSVANQLMPWAYNGLALEEIACLLGSVKKALGALIEQPAMTKKMWLEFETLLLIHVMLWTGSDADRAAKVSFCGEDRYDMASDVCIVIPKARPVTQFCWRIRALAPEYKTDLAGTKSELREMKPAIDLPDHINLAALIQRVVLEPKRGHHKSSLFSTAPDVLKSSLAHWLKLYSPDGRVTSSKLAGTLWSHLHRDIGDSATVSCISGELHNLARVRLHYTSPLIFTLQKHYQATVLKIAELSYAALNKNTRSVTSWLPGGNTGGAIGARLCPTVEAVRNMFLQLATDITTASDYTDRKNFIHFHNLFTLYTVQYFAYATTCRAIITPYVSLNSVHPTRGLTTLSDKDDESCHKTRLVWIPPPLRAQMAAYENHIVTLKAQLIDQPAAVVSEPCFFLNDKFYPIAVRPKTIEPRLAAYLNIKANTHRRFLRTELIERNCPPEVVDAFMGHWQQGEEPFGDYSSFCFADYIEILRGYLEPLLSDIGLTRRIPSRLAT